MAGRARAPWFGAIVLVVLGLAISPARAQDSNPADAPATEATVETPPIDDAPVAPTVDVLTEATPIDEAPATEAPPIEASPEPAAAAYPCPALKTDGSRDAAIMYTYTWINDGCPTPIRRGFYARDGFGWDHIEFRRIVDGQINHQTTAYARNLWAQALATPGASGPPLTCHQKKYQTPGGTKRTMVVVHSHTNYKNSLGRKGIITAYWISGHVNGCTKVTGS